VFDKVLVCNRGEIAVRIIRACRQLGLATVAVYSAADRDSMPVRLADEAVCIGPGPAAQSYLNIPAILYACAKTGAQALHPGYGLLSEDADFAEICADTGITFIGPPATAIRAMGDKTAARTIMRQAGVPTPPGDGLPLEDLDQARQQAAEIGYPVIVKAAAGGGGRGMRIVPEAADLPGAFAEVRSTARKIFLDDRIYLEKFIAGARHVEFQVLGDSHGHIVHLGERDCSIQRRQQKVVEESPSTVIDARLREQMGAAAVLGAQAVDYTSAGTMEFLVDSSGRFYFMEMNPRIQVEHPVTEMLTGIDLVSWMIRIAAGERLSFGQRDVRMSGHALQVRVTAEDPAAGWQGACGALTSFTPPGGPRVRVDTHAYPGYTVPPYYDSLLAKVIVHGDDREHAIRLMDCALAEFDCSGLSTTIGFHRDLLRHPVFRAGTHRLDFLERYMRPGGQLTA